MSLEQALVEHCAPTLAGVKVGNLFRYKSKSDDIDSLVDEVEYWNRELADKGIRLAILKKCIKSSSYLLYLYREQELAVVLQEDCIKDFLKKCDYCEMATQDCYIKQLINKLNHEDCFPHEIGLFLGYPLDDVAGFMANNGQNYTLAGPWKSYGDAVTASKEFKKLDCCRSVYKKNFRCGRSLKSLAVG